MELIRSGRRRDLRVDFFRGLALWWIYTDHIPGDVLGDYSMTVPFASPSARSADLGQASA